MPSNKRNKADKAATAATATEAAAKADDARVASRLNVHLASATYPFGKLSARDEAYLAFYASFGKRTIALSELISKRVNPYYTGASARADDDGVLDRLSTAGYIDIADGFAAITFRDNKAHDYAKACLSKRKQ